MSNECRFYPVQCSENTLQTLKAQEGHVYFTTDTKKIYLGKNNKLIPMCAATGFFYGTKDIEYDNSGNLPDPKVIFYFDEIEGVEIPEIDDLILNIDGCFYRVKEITEEDITTERLTLQGSGVGGGGTGDGPGSSGSFRINITDGVNKVYSSTATSMEVSFIGHYNGTDGNLISQVSFIKKGDTDPFYTYIGDMAFNETHTIDLFPYMDQFGSTKTTVTMAVQDMYGMERSMNFSIQIVELAIQMAASDLLYTDADAYSYTCNLAGATSGVTNKKITYTFYHQDDLNKVVATQIKELSVSDEGPVQTELKLQDLPHGIYVMKVVASANIGTSNAVIFSNELTHKIAHFITDEPLLMIMTPERTEQYTNIPINYLLVTSEANKTYTLDIIVGRESKIKLAIKSNAAGSYPLYFEEKGIYSLSCNIIELAGTSYAQDLNIVPYTGNLPVIDPARDDLMLYLSPKGKSNDAIDRNEWKDYKGTYTANLNGLHYGKANGWLMDENGVSYLKLSSGASLILDDFLPFKNDPTKSGSDSRMGYGMTIELDFEISGVLDYGTELIKCISTNQNGVIQVGFSITGDQIRFFNSRLNDGVNADGESIGSLMSLNIVEGKRIRVSFVIEPNPDIEGNYPMCYTYLNGKLSAAVIYDKDDSYKDSIDNPARLRVNAQDAQIKLYGIRFYSSALTDKIILNNYTASLPTLEARQAQYDSNNVFNANGKIDYALVAAEDYNLQIPYMKITGGWATEKDAKWQLKNQTNANVGLPTGKKDYRLIDVEVKYPKNDYFADYHDYKFVNEFASGKPMSQAYGEKPSNGGAIMYSQGTSSMEYPVKNLRLRFKNDEDFYVVRPDIAAVEIICMKADYMESSGSHNTGAANLVDALYTGVGMKTPGQSHFGGEGKDTIVTCIKGHPCLIFYSETGEAGSYKYIGKYNLNLDKATPEPFGFNHDDDTFGYLPEGEKYYEIQYDDDGTQFIGQQKPSKGGDYVAGQTEVEKTVAAGEKINSIHCFEFLDNAVEVCNFLNKYKAYIKDEAGNLIPDPNGGVYSYHDTWYNTFVNSDNEKVPGWTLGFESRYPEDRIGYHDADMLFPLANWLNELYLMRKAEEAEGKKPTNITYIYEYTEAEKYEDFVGYYIKTESGEYIEAYPSAEDFGGDIIYYTRKTTGSRFEMDSLERFKREFHIYLDKDFLLTYYLVTEALLMADSRVKNMMIATWGKEKRTYKTLTDEIKEANNYIFYPIFYDMDTMLGLDNTGVYRFEYHDEDTDSSIFNGDEVLWNFVRDALADELTPWYSELEGSLLTADSILPYFNQNQANMANEAFYNGDAVYKYTDPAREGYYDYLNGKIINPGEGPYLYAAQGDRSLMREWFLTNRIKFLRGKYNSKNYQSGDRIEFRWYYPTGAEADEKLNASRAAVPPDGKFKFTSLKTGYSGVKLGANGNVYNERFENEETKEINLPEASSANGTEAYLLGLSNLTDLGDLSNKYMQKFIIASQDVRLKHLTLGNPHQDYHNPYWKPGKGQSQKIGLSGCTYLETFNLQNCSAYNNTLDFSASPAIKKILLTGSGVTGITLPVNGLLEELRLPQSTTTIKIDSHSALTDAGFTVGNYVYDENYKDDKGYVTMGGNGYYENDFSNIQKLYVVNTPINTYEMIRQAAGNFAEYYLQGINWIITEDDTRYCIRFKDDYDATKTYYYYESGNYIKYEGTEYPTDKSLYEKFTMLDSDKKVTCIPMLEYLQTRTFMSGTKHGEALTGTITINIPGASVDDLEIYRKYIDIFPDVKIKYGSDMEVDEAFRINFYRIDTVSAENLEVSDIEKIEPYFATLTQGAETLAELIDNKDFRVPTKASTNYFNYNFTGRWHDWNDENKTIYYQDSYLTEGESYATQFSKIKPNKTMMLIPEFEEAERTYKIAFYVEGSEAFHYELPYNVNVGTATHGNPSIEYIYLPDYNNELGENERFAFKKWISEEDYQSGIANPKKVIFNDLYVQGPMNFYAYFEVEDATKVASDYRIFVIDNIASSINGESISGQYRIRINSNEAFNQVIGGKITLPSKDENGNVIKIIDNFKEIRAENNVEIYFLEDAAYESIADTAFEYSRVADPEQGYVNEFSIKAIYLPNTIKTIGNNAFKETLIENIALPETLTTIGEGAFNNVKKLALAALPTNLVKLGARAFAGCSNITISELPAGITKIPTQCFALCPKLKITQLGGPEFKALEIERNAFISAATDSSITELSILKPVSFTDEALASSVFTNGYSNIATLTVHSLFGFEDESNMVTRLFGGAVPATLKTITVLADN